MGFPADSVVKNLPTNAGDVGHAGSIPGSGGSPGGGNGNPLQYSCLEKSMDRGAWWAIQSIAVQRVGYNCHACTHLFSRSLTSCCHQSSPRLPFMVHPPGTPALDTEGLKLSLGPSPSQCSVLPQPIPSLSPEALQAERQLSYGNDGCAAQLFFSVGAERKKKEKTQVLGEGSPVCV